MQLCKGALAHVDTRPVLSEIDVPIICIQSTQNNFVKPLHTDPYVSRRGGEVRSIHKARNRARAYTHTHTRASRFPSSLLSSDVGGSTGDSYALNATGVPGRHGHIMHASLCSTIAVVDEGSLLLWVVAATPRHIRSAAASQVLVPLERHAVPGWHRQQSRPPLGFSLDSQSLSFSDSNGGHRTVNDVPPRLRHSRKGQTALFLIKYVPWLLLEVVGGSAGVHK